MIILSSRDQTRISYKGKWVYFGRDYTNMLQWRKRLGSETQISYGQILTEQSEALRQPFIDWVSSLSSRYPKSLDWWMTRLAGHNVLLTPIFLHLTYLQVLNLLLKEPDINRKPLLVICEDWFLLKTFLINLRRDGYKVKHHGLWWVNDAAMATKAFYKAVTRWSWYLFRQIQAHAAARITAMGQKCAPQENKKQIIIHTCIDEECFKDAGSFYDLYFTSLPSWLSQKDFQVSTIPWLYNIRRSFYSAYRSLRSSPHRFLILEDYMRFWDYPVAVWRILRTGRVLRGVDRFLQHDVRPLVWREKITNAFSGGPIRFLLYIPALRRWFASGNRCDIFIDMFENMYTERTQLFALRHYSPRTLTIGYAHSIATPNHLDFIVTKTEWDNGIFPDRIVTNGKITWSLLASGGIPRSCLLEGPALRSKDILRNGPAQTVGGVAKDQTSMLVLLSLDLSASVELMTRLIEIQQTLKEMGLLVLLKIHPMMKKETLMKATGIRELPQRWTWIAGKLGDYLSSTLLAVGTATSALVEAAASGIPVIAVGKELDLAYNPMERWRDKHPECDTTDPSSLEAKILQICKHGVAYNMQLSTDILEGLGPLDEAHYSVFLP